MADVHTKKQRSYNMSQIRSKNTKPELIVRSWLHKQGYRFRLHDKKLPGKPDIVLPKYKTIIFIHGCYWHGHKGCKYFTIPKTRTDWWTIKLLNNKKKDIQNYRMLHKTGWQVINVWECKLKPNLIEKTLSKIIKKINA